MIGVFILCTPPDKIQAAHNEDQTDGRPTPGNQRGSVAAAVLSVARLISGGPPGRPCKRGGSHPDEKILAVIYPPAVPSQKQTCGVGYGGHLELGGGASAGPRRQRLPLRICSAPLPP